MKRFFLKSVACLSIAFMLAVILPNINHPSTEGDLGWYKIANAATTTPQINPYNTTPDFSRQVAAPTVGPTLQNAAEQNEAENNEPFVRYNTNTTEAPTSGATQPTTVNSQARTDYVNRVGSVPIGSTGNIDAYPSLDNNPTRTNTTQTTPAVGPTTQAAVVQRINATTNNDPRFTAQDRETIAAFERAINDPNTTPEKKAEYEATLAEYKENAIASTEISGSMEVGGQAVKGFVAKKVVEGINWILYGIQAFLATLLGYVAKLMDSVMLFTMEIGKHQDIVGVMKQSWVILRDTFNVFFIFILLYISIQTILKGAAAKTKEMLANVIISALLINFSLLITNAIIDTSNIFTVAIYNSGQNIAGNQASISENIMNSLKIQSLEKTKETLNKASIGLTILILLKILMISVTLWAFLKLLVLLLTRLIAFFLLMALSPVGFIGNVIPKMGEYSKKWWDTLIDQSLVGPIFAFLFLIILTLVKDGGPLGSNGSADGGLVGAIASMGFGTSNGKIAGVLINVAIVIGFLIATVKVTKKLSGELGAAASSLGAKALGAAAGLALGGTAILGRQLVGRGAAALVKNDKLQGAAANNVVARLALRGVNNVSKSTFDARNTGLAKTVNKKLGVDLGSGGGKGGFIAEKDAYIKQTVEDSKMLKRDMTSDASIDRLEQVQMGKIAEKQRAAIEGNIKDIESNKKEVETMTAEKTTLEERNKAIEEELSHNIPPREADKLKQEKADNMRALEAKGKAIAMKEHERGAKEQEKLLREKGEKVEELTEEEKKELKKSVETEHQNTLIKRTEKSKFQRYNLGGERNRSELADKLRKEMAGETKEQQLARLARETTAEADKAKASAAPGSSTTGGPAAGSGGTSGSGSGSSGGAGSGGGAGTP